jgi:hypothetical protein
MSANSNKGNAERNFRIDNVLHDTSSPLGLRRCIRQSKQRRRFAQEKAWLLI